MRASRRRAGLGLGEVVVVLVLVVALGLMILIALPRGRESARSAGCQRNLMRIGVALNLYAQATKHYPSVPAPGEPGPGPLAELLGGLGQEDLSEMVDPTRPPSKRSKPRSDPRTLADFICPADPAARAANFPAPVSYRATAGSGPAGDDGPFALGRSVGPADVEAGDGLAYTAGFSERLVGTGRDGVVDPRNYALAPGPIGPAGCPAAPASAERGDAGSSWADADWRSTLYNHLVVPNGSPSCIAADGATAAMGASSGHVGRVHLLMLDGSVRAVTPTVDPTVWQGWARYRNSARAGGPTIP